MVDGTILTVTGDNELVEQLRQQLHERGGSGNHMIVAATIDEACSLLATAQPRLVVVHWAVQGARYEEFDRLLWTTTVLARRIPVLVIADRYRIDQATTLYRMGVNEYVSRTHHRGQLGKVLGAFLPQAVGLVSRSAVSPSQAEQAVKVWAAPEVGARVMSSMVGEDRRYDSPYSL
jgi:DNA-binding NarL/FixJ family response regulator